MPKCTKTSQIFKNALPHLRNGTEVCYNSATSSYICYAIEYGNNFPDAKRGKGVIMERLDELPDVECWLMRNVPVAKKHMNNLAVIQAYRKRWLESLITEFESKGD